MLFKIRLFYTLAAVFFMLSISCPAASADTFQTSSSSASVGAIFASQGSQSIIYQEGFNRIDAFMSLPKKERMLLKYGNKSAYVGAGSQVFSPTFLPDEKGGIWIKPYTLFENVRINNGPDVSNVGYGVLLGADTPLKHFKHDYSGYLTAYAAYGGSHQNYHNASDNESSGSIALTGALYKGNFFTGLTLSAGGLYDISNEGLNTGNSSIFLAGAGWKVGYNYELLDGKVIVQPSFLGIYTFDKFFPYTSPSGQNVTINNMHVVQLIPQVQIIGNLKGGWQPYVRVNMVWPVMDSPKVYLDGVLQPRMSVGPYVEYGLGVQRRWKERYTSYGQIMFRGGERNGVSIHAGFRLALGK